MRDALAALERRLGGRVGVCAFRVGGGGRLERRADERFAFCSTFKWALAAAVLARVDRGEMALDELVAFGNEDLQSWAPFTRAHLAEGRVPVEALARAAVTVSDNTATNLLLARLGGPAALTRFFREIGDTVTRLDRDEPSLNTNRAGDARDTTSPRAMAGALERVLTGEVLSLRSRETLTRWLVETETGRARLRAGLPPGWRAGDKTGTGKRRKYLHDAEEAAPYKQDPGTFTPWEDVPSGTDLLFYEGLHGAVVTPEINIAQHPDLLIGVV
ncbi:MAG TPA: class A beta-lactamase, partial [Polyangiaceae bacterium]|nr:class A beta-lactamase [Polyangiaceae bacterium]